LVHHLAQKPGASSAIMEGLKGNAETCDQPKDFLIDGQIFGFPSGASSDFTQKYWGRPTFAQVALVSCKNCHLDLNTDIDK
jgi:hypothetical protein